VKDWFEDWFGREYLALYPHRDSTEARAAIDLVARVSGASPTARVLDLACGAGRHARILSERWSTVGLDLSMTLLYAAKEEAPAVPFVRGDMRALPYRDASFDVVVNLFTSFGYFDNDAQHLRVLAEVARVTCRDGIFVLDFLNADTTRRTLVPYDQRHVGDRVVEQHRRISSDGHFVEKRIVLREDGREYRERVRLYDADELEVMLGESGFNVEHHFGDYSGSECCTDSARVILFARRE
jgi:SAM-dependent methyltransferase